nr:MAG TPA: hypothetical protein [Caudoviricetes sp.]
MVGQFKHTLTITKMVHVYSHYKKFTQKIC